MSQLKRNIVYQYGLQAAKYIFPFITLPYLTRVLGPDSYAIKAYVVSVMSFFQVFLDYGFLPYGTRKTALIRGDNRAVRMISTDITVARIMLCLVGILPLLLLACSIEILRAHPLYVVFAYLGVCARALLPDFIFQGFEEMEIITRRFVLSQAVVVFLTFVFIHSSDDLIWVPVLELVGALIGLIWSWHNVIAVRKISFVRFKLLDVARSLKDSTPYFISNASTTALTGLTTVFMGVFLSDKADIAFWSLSMSVIAAAQSLFSPITNSIFPRICVEKSFRTLKQSLLLGMPIVTAAAVCLMVLAEPTMLILGGRAYLPASKILSFVAPVLVFSYPVCMLGYPVLAATGHSVALTVSSLIATAFNLAGLVLLIILNCFTLEAVSILRCMTEMTLAVIRSAMSYPYLRYGYYYRREKT